MSVSEESPSAERRKALKEADAANQLRVLGSCALSKYIDIADRLLERFQDAIDGRRLDEAYVFGLRFANLCLSSLPQHPEWKRDTSKRDRKRLTSSVGDVLSMMDVIKQRMDAEELMKIKAEMIAKQEEEARKKQEEDRRKQQLDEASQREQKIRNALEQERAQFLAEQRAIKEEEMKQKLKVKLEKEKVAKEKEKIAKEKENTAKKNDIEKSAMAKLQAMQAQMSKAEQAPPKKEVVESKKKAEKPKTTKAKTKDSKTKIPLVRAMKKAIVKPKEEDAKIVAPQTTSEAIDAKIGSNALTMATTTEVQVEVPQKPSSTTEQDWIQSQRSERKSSENDNNQEVPTSVQNQENETDSEPVEEETKITPKENPKSSSIRLKFKKNDSDSTRSASLKKSTTKSTPMSFIKSKMESAKSSIPTMPLNMLKPSAKISANDTVGVPATKISIKGSAKSSTDPIIAAKLNTPRSRAEKASIDKLKRVITIQEDRLENIEGKQIPSLLEAAKTCLKEDKKNEALKCLAHKKRLERMVDTIKAAVFNMETQMFMLESAIEDRHVKKALDEAASAMAGLQQNIGDPNMAVVDLKDMSASLPELEIGDATDEELMEELEQWLSPEDKQKSQERMNADDISLLSMPAFLPAAPEAALTSPSVDRILSPVAGE